MTKITHRLTAVNKGNIRWGKNVCRAPRKKTHDKLFFCHALREKRTTNNFFAERFFSCAMGKTHGKDPLCRAPERKRTAKLILGNPRSLNWGSRMHKSPWGSYRSLSIPWPLPRPGTHATSCWFRIRPIGAIRRPAFRQRRVLFCEKFFTFFLIPFVSSEILLL
jgi:hypothetical protein